jgi:hypothetical protein
MAHAISLWVNALPHAIRVEQGEKPAIIASDHLINKLADKVEITACSSPLVSSGFMPEWKNWNNK